MDNHSKLYDLPPHTHVSIHAHSCKETKAISSKSHLILDHPLLNIFVFNSSSC
jgi:hypothetical protein